MWDMVNKGEEREGRKALPILPTLLTGEGAISSLRLELGRNLATHFLISMEENKLFDILDARVLREGKREEIVCVAEVARRCLHFSGKKRPTMKEVAVELEAIATKKTRSSSVGQNEDDVGIDEVAECYELSSIFGILHSPAGSDRSWLAGF